MFLIYFGFCFRELEWWVEGACVGPGSSSDLERLPQPIWHLPQFTRPWVQPHLTCTSVYQTLGAAALDMYLSLPDLGCSTYLTLNSIYIWRSFLYSPDISDYSSCIDCGTQPTITSGYPTIGRSSHLTLTSVSPGINRSSNLTLTSVSPWH